MTSEFSIDVQVNDQRVRYVDRSRGAFIRLESDNNGDWWLWPDTLNWWERTAVDSPEAFGSGFNTVREPVSDAERSEILQRVMKQLREKHKMWTNIAGQTNDPRPATWKAPPVRTDVDPELAFIMEGEVDGPMPGEVALDDAALLEKIDRALAEIQPLADQGWEQAQSIARQLHWCRGTVRGEAVETPPGPLSMGLIATREFDMYGQEPERARLINDIQRAMKQRGGGV